MLGAKAGGAKAHGLAADVSAPRVVGVATPAPQKRQRGVRGLSEGSGEAGS